MAGMMLLEIKKLVDRYIGTAGGNLGQSNEYSYRTLQNFYPEYCSLNYDTNKYQGTKRERLKRFVPRLLGIR